MKRRPLLLAAFITLFTAVGLAFAQEKGTGALPAGGGIEVLRMLEPGAAAPGFTVRDIGGEIFNFESEKTKSPYLLVFISIFCEPCRREMAIVRKMHEKYRDAGLRVAAVALDGEPLKHAVAGFARQEGYAFRVLIDELDARESFKVSESYGISVMPSTFVVEKGGRIAFGRTGLVKEEELEKTVQSVLKP
jgi:peroxiredoxin